MNNERISQLLSYYKEDPSDPFNIYCLATEYKEYNPDEAWRYFSILLDAHSDYLPTYYHAALIMIDKDEIDEAEKLIDTGLELARKQNNQLALRELGNLLDNLLDY